jgi:uncharacterized protein YfaS (alpha-2-macroglobulin family)
MYDYLTPGPVFGSPLRDRAMMLETLVLMKRFEEARDLAMMIIDDMNSLPYMSTQTTAFSLYGLFRFAEATKAQEKMSFDYTVEGESGKIDTFEKAYSIELQPGKAPKQTFRIVNNGTGMLFVTKTLTGQPAVGEEREARQNLTMQISYLSSDGKLLNTDTLRQGTDFIARVTLKPASSMQDYDNMVLRQVFPSGWEVINTRISSEVSPSKGSAYDFRDIRDDRVYTFFSIGGRQEVTYYVNLNAAYTGRFYLPAATCRTMYGNNVFAASKGRWVNVVK